MTPDAVSRALADGLDSGVPVRLDLDAGGAVFVDHPVPLLAVHRCRAATTGDPALDAHAACHEAHRLVTTQPAYVIASEAEGGGAVVAAVSEAIRARLDAPLVVEVWAPLDDEAQEGPDPFDRAPGFTIYTSDAGPSAASVEAMCDALSGIEIAGQGAQVDRVVTSAVAPPGLDPLDVPGPVVGLAVDAVFLNARDGEFYPRVLDRIRAALAPALHAVGTAETAAPGPVLARTTLEPVAVEVDRGLAEVAESFGFLLQVTPVNGAQAWADFQSGGCDRAPELLYRPLTFDPDEARRRLFALPLGEIEDPVVEGLLRECRDEIEAHVRMVLDIGTRQFMPTSLRVYGAPDPDLVALAEDLVGALDRRPRAGGAEERVGATAFAAAARAELEGYHAEYPGLDVEVEVRDDIPGSLMVSRGRLLVGAAMNIPVPRVRALLAHEVGTHVLTFANGTAQPIQQFRHGLAGYEDLQEGLAVLSEWLVDGLTAGRFRTLAGRVIGCDAMVAGADFVETFRTVRDGAGLSDRRAFGIALRLHRGGGLTKDMVYLRGLRDLLRHLGAGGEYWTLFVGKMALRHLPAVTDLLEREVLRPPPLRPSYARDPRAMDRLDRARLGLSVLDLLDG